MQFASKDGQVFEIPDLSTAKWCYVIVHLMQGARGRSGVTRQTPEEFALDYIEAAVKQEQFQLSEILEININGNTFRAPR